MTTTGWKRVTLLLREVYLVLFFFSRFFGQFVPGVWLCATAGVKEGRQKFDSDDQRVYDVVWEHGLLLACINQATASSNKRFPPQIQSLF